MSTHHLSSSSSSTSATVDRLLTRSLPSTREDYFIIQQKSKTAAASAVDNNNSASSSSSSSSSSSENCCNNSSQNNNSTTTNTSSRKSSSKKSQFESLSTDITSHILSYLHPTELYNISLISKSGYGMFNCDLLWRCNFSIWWNCFPDFDILDHRHHHRHDNNDATADATDSESHNCTSSSSSSSSSSGNGGFWKRCFINSYTNHHDLWIRHWNCVYPEDVTIVPGRTVIPTDQLRLQQQQRERLQLLGLQEGKMKQQEQRNNEEDEEQLTKFQKEFDSPMLRYCPTCRYYPTTLNSTATATNNNNIGYYSNVVVNEAVNAELCYANQQLKWQGQQQQQDDDPIETAEIVASAHALLNNSSPSSIRRRRSYDNDAAAAATGGGRYGTLHGCSSISKTIYYATQYSIAKWCRHLRMIVDKNNNNDEDCEEDGDGGGGGKDEFTTKTCSSYWIDSIINDIDENEEMDYCTTRQST